MDDHRTRSILVVVLVVSAFALAGCISTPPTLVPPGVSSASPATSADIPSSPSPDLTAVPGGPTTQPGAVACPDIADCLPALRALKGVIPDPVPDGQVLVVARACPAGVDCRTGVHAIAVLVPRGWRLGDAFIAAWTVDGVEGSLAVNSWTEGSLPEDVLPVIREWAGRL